MSKLLTACVLIMVAMSVFPVRAASFDCAKAVTAHEKHLCQSAILNSADERMGQSYRSALSTFPVKGFVRANQQRFLLSYKFCDSPGAQACRKTIEDRIVYLDGMQDAIVFSDVRAGTPFSAENGVFWLKASDKVPVLHYFGSYMPDMNKPEPFPEGFVCDDAAALRGTGSGWLAVDDRDEVVVSDSMVKAKISCSPRNGLFGEYQRVTDSTVKPNKVLAGTPTFTDPAALVTWLLQHSSRDFRPEDDNASDNVFSPGLRAALRATYLRSRQRNEPPCGANGDIILDTQEEGAPANLRVSVQPTGSDRVTVATSYDIAGYHRDRRYLTINLGGVWKLENIIEADGSSLRRSLDCR